jgi:hypothetical protein
MNRVMDPSDTFFGFLYLAALIIIIVILLFISTHYKRANNLHNWWPQWLGGRPVPQSVAVRTNVSTGPYFDRPWGGASRYANGGAPS